MMSGRTIRCILFDLGSTLWTRREDTALLAERAAYQRAGAMLRRALGDELFAALDDAALGALLQQSIERQTHADQLQHPGYEPDGALATLRVIQEFRREDVHQMLAEAVFEALRVRIPDSRMLFPDTISTLAALKERGYLLGVVTNRSYGGRLFREDVAAMGLFDYFAYAHMTISADVGVCKPNPAIFKVALNSLNASPGETAMVGNSLKADIAGAKGLNLFSIWKTAIADVGETKRTVDTSAIEPDVEIERLDQLLEIFLEIV